MWTAREVPREFVTAEFLYDMTKRHGLLQHNTAAAVQGLVSTAEGAIVHTFWAGEDLVATLVISRITDYGQAEIDFIPVRLMFRGRQQANLVESVVPVIRRVMHENEIRRLTAWIPASRTRSARALADCGFRQEGDMQKAVQLEGSPPENLLVFGYVKE